MANKQELIDKIQTIARRVYSAKVKDDTLGVTTNDVDFDTETFPILSKFPTLKQIIINLLTDQYELFLSDIHWVAPRPTTFKVLLANGQYFYLIYTERSWIAKIEGKKYYMLNLGEEEKAVASLARILMYGSKADPEKESSNTVPSGGEIPADEPTPEAPPADGGEEPAEEEVPETVPA